jgi:DNA mismatch repair ATPase MutS
MLKQFMDMKKKHPDALLLFRCGDFYETYMQDAEKSSKILGITLTKSSKTKDPDGKPLAMAGFPYHALDTYLPKLIRAGQRVAICDQIEAPKQTTKRGISEMLTPGAATEKEQKTQPKEDQAQGFHR